MNALAKLPVEGLVLREAMVEDVPAIVELLVADQLGAIRDGITTDADLQAYLRAFEAIDADPAHLLLVAGDGGRVLATMQLSFLPGLARRGALRAQTRRSEFGRTTAAGDWEPRCSTGRSRRHAAEAAPWSS